MRRRNIALFVIVLSGLILLIKSPKAYSQTNQYTIIKQISSSADDVNEDGTGYSTSDATVWLGNGASTTAGYMGLRYNSISIPQSAVINSAHLEFYSSTNQWIGMSFNIGADASGNSLPFSSISKPSGRVLTSARVIHSSGNQWLANTWYYLKSDSNPDTWDDLSPIVQEIVNRNDWTSGNSLSLILKGTGGQWARKFVTSVDGSASFSPKLVITYTSSLSGPTNTPTLTPAVTSTPTLIPTLTPTPAPTVTLIPSPTPASGSTIQSIISLQVNGSTDDMNQTSSSKIDLTNTTVWLGTGTSTTYSYTGLRYNNVLIPRGSTINSAYLTVYSSQNQLTQMSMSIAAEKIGNSPTFSSSNKPSQRVLTTNKVNHSSNTQWYSNTWYSLNEMYPVIQEVVNRSDWTSGNSLSVIIKGTGSTGQKKNVTSFNGSPVFASRLIIYFTPPVVPTATPAPTFTPSPTLTATPAPTQSVITLNPAVTRQTIIGWEAVAQAGQDYAPNYSQQYTDVLMTKAADLGINRIRLETRSKDKAVDADWDVAEVDSEVDNVITPLAQKIGGKNNLFVTLTLVGDQLENDKPKLASQSALMYQHLNIKYGWVPDAFEILEPTNFGWDSGDSVTQAFDYIKGALIRNGYTPYFVLPSSECGAATAIYFFGTMKNSPLWVNIEPYFHEFSYHRYCATSDQDLVNVSNIGVTEGVKTAMLEHIGSGYEDLVSDLKIASVSAWEQFTLAWPGTDDGGAYFPIDSTQTDPNLMVTTGSRTKLLRQYFKYIKRGAVRIDAASNNSLFDPLAFINTNGGYAVIVKANGGGSFILNGLPAGTYGIFYTTQSEYDVHYPDVTISAGEGVNTQIPAAGAITIYNIPAPTPTPTP